MRSVKNQQLCQGVRVINVKNKFSRVVGALLLIGMMLFSVSFVAASFSGAFTVGNFSILGLKSKAYPEKHFYAVTLGEYDNLAEATQNATHVSAMGASGYVWAEGGRYLVIGSIYHNKSHAQQVSLNITGDFTVGVHQITCKKITPALTGSAENQFLEGVDYLYTTALGMEEQAINLEKNQTTQVACASLINNYKSQILVYKTQIDYLIAGQLNQQLLKLKNTLTQVEGVLDTTTAAVLAGKSTAVKYGCAEIVFILKAFADSV